MLTEEGILTDQEFDDLVIAGVASIHKRGVLITHNTRALHRLRALEGRVEELQSELLVEQSKPAPVVVPATLDTGISPAQIAEWIERTNPGDTVRAKYARKIAQQIREGMCDG